jgi:hypothetical protein
VGPYEPSRIDHFLIKRFIYFLIVLSSDGLDTRKLNFQIISSSIVKTIEDFFDLIFLTVTIYLYHKIVDRVQPRIPIK